MKNEAKPDLPPASLTIAKRVAHEVWEKYDDTYGYRTEKQDANARVPEDHPSNIWFFWNQFDVQNQREFLFRVTDMANDNALGAVELERWCLDQFARTVEAIEHLREKGIEI